jgi:hypothetical protein
MTLSRRPLSPTEEFLVGIGAIGLRSVEEVDA